MNKEFWNLENKVRLIELYKNHTLLWDPSHKDHKNNFKRREAFESIARELGIENVFYAKKKIDSLLIQYRREMKLTSTTSETGTNEKKKPWWGVEYLDFLKDKIILKKSTISREIRIDEPHISFVDVPTCFSSNSSCPSSPNSKRFKVDETYQIMEECYEELKQAKERDEHSIYGENVANRLRKIKDSKRLCILKNKIDNLIFDAEMEECCEPA